MFHHQNSCFQPTQYRGQFKVWWGRFTVLNCIDLSIYAEKKLEMDKIIMPQEHGAFYDTVNDEAKALPED